MKLGLAPPSSGDRGHLARGDHDGPSARRGRESRAPGRSAVPMYGQEERRRPSAENRPGTGAALHRRPARGRCDRHDRPWTTLSALPVPVGAGTPAAGRAGDAKTDIVVPVSVVFVLRFAERIRRKRAHRRRLLVVPPAPTAATVRAATTHSIPPVVAPTPTRSATDTPRPSLATANGRTPARHPSSHRTPDALPDPNPRRHDCVSTHQPGDTRPRPRRAHRAGGG